MVSPAIFIPVAEEIGLIGPDQRVGAGNGVRAEPSAGAMQGCRCVVSVNISPQQFRGDGLVPLIAGVLSDTGLEAELLRDRDHREHRHARAASVWSRCCTRSRSSACTSPSTISAPAIRA